MDEFQQKAYGLILGDARKAFDLSQEKDAIARSLRPQSVRPVLPAGPPPGGGRRSLHHDQRWRLGHPQRQLRDHETEAARSRTRLSRRCSKTWRSAACCPAPSSPGSANSAAPRASPTKPPGSADAITGPPPFPPWSRAAASRADRCSAPPTRAAKTSATARSIRGISRPASTNCSASIPTGRLPHPQGCVAYVSPLGGSLLTEIM